jgi:zinc D-Ala-D-Ala carboxypeptidase
MREDIPEALREASTANSSKRPVRSVPQSQGGRLILWGVVGLLAALALSWLLARPLWSGLFPLGETSRATPTPVAERSEGLQAPAGGQNIAGQNTGELLGHLAYAEAPGPDLQALSSNANIRLRRAAKEKYEAMATAAQADGVDLVVISGFRSLKDQNHLFFDIKAERGQAPRERAQVSAPPGFSEHHTGYAIDLGDRSRPEADLNPNFDQTPAFRWLAANAARYSFELSFPKGNTQGVTYEPWHWRFVGDSESLKTFYAARRPKPAP